jgi:hypothetical protein
MKTRKTQLKRMLMVTLLGCVIFAGSVTNVQAGSSLRKGVKGAAAGALIGAAPGGSEGAAKGAMIGGGVGILAGSDDKRRNKRHKNKRNRAKQHKRRR